MRIRINHHAAVRLELEPGDELLVKKLSPALENLLTSDRVDGAGPFAHIVTDGDVDEGEFAVVPPAGETTTMGRGRREPRATPVSK